MKIPRYFHAIQAFVYLPHLTRLKYAFKQTSTVHEIIFMYYNEGNSN